VVGEPRTDPPQVGAERAARVVGGVGTALDQQVEAGGVMGSPCRSDVGRRRRCGQRPLP
jgi:hypothetical protein